MRVLLLNASYEPLKIISRNRAVTLMVMEEADSCTFGDSFAALRSGSVPCEDSVDEPCCAHP
jgi:hypothetical protein